MAPGAEQDFECVGSGIVDFPAIFKEARKQHIEHYFVERDKVPDGMACLASAAEYLKMYDISRYVIGCDNRMSLMRQSIEIPHANRLLIQVPD